MPILNNNQKLDSNFKSVPERVFDNQNLNDANVPSNKEPQKEGHQDNSENESKPNLQNNSENDPENDLIVPKADMEFAQQVIFQGYATKNIKLEHLDTYYTITNINCVEMELIDLCVQAYTEKFKDGENYHINTVTVKKQETSFFMAMCFEGFAGKDFLPETSNATLSVLKKSIKSYSSNFDLKIRSEQKKTIMEKMEVRCEAIKRLDPTFVDLVVGEHSKLNDNLSAIFSNKNIILK